MSVRLDMVGIFVEDIGKMVSFYRDAMGFGTSWKSGEPYAEFRNEGVRFSMYVRSELPKLLGAEPSYPTGINGTFELAIDLPGTKEVDREYSRLVGCGARGVYTPREEPWGMYSSMVMDPEGNLIEIGSWKKGKTSEIQLGVVTIPVSSLSEARKYYRDVLGFLEDACYEPTSWVSYKSAGTAFLAIQEVPGLQAGKQENAIDFYLDGIDELWQNVKDRVDVVSKPKRTPWGSYKFVIRDPDGNRLGFVKKEEK